MQSYSDETQRAAKQALPIPLQDFLGSKELQEAFNEISKTEGLNLRQAEAMIQIVTFVLLGLDPESSLEAKLKEVLKELSPSALQKLLRVIDEKVLKKARQTLNSP